MSSSPDLRVQRTEMPYAVYGQTGYYGSSGLSETLQGQGLRSSSSYENMQLHLHKEEQQPYTEANVTPPFGTGEPFTTQQKQHAAAYLPMAYQGSYHGHYYDHGSQLPLRPQAYGVNYLPLVHAPRNVQSNPFATPQVLQHLSASSNPSEMHYHHRLVQEQQLQQQMQQQRGPQQYLLPGQLEGRRGPLWLQEGLMGSNSLHVDGREVKPSRRSKILARDSEKKRKEKNRIVAKRTRLRKKFFQESLRIQIHELLLENRKLRVIIKDKLEPEKFEALLSSCSAPSTVKEIPWSVRSLDTEDRALLDSVSQSCFIIMDPKVPGTPIVYVSKAFEELTLYKKEEIVGGNCDFLSGPETDPQKTEKLLQSMRKGTDCSMILLHYRADGTPFLNQVFVGGLRDQVKIVNIILVCTEFNLAEGAD